MTGRTTSLVVIGALALIAYVSFLGAVDLAYLHLDTEAGYQAALADVPTRFDIISRTERAVLRMNAGQGGVTYLDTFDFLFATQRRATLAGLWFGWHYGRLAWWIAWAPAIALLEVLPLVILANWRRVRQVPLVTRLS